jgi:hypothetical protein
MGSSGFSSGFLGLVTRLGLMLLLAGCQPEDVTPGLWLQGEEVSATVDSWQFTDAVEEIFIETEPWYFVAQSTTIWCVHHAGSLYIGSYGTEKKTWEKNVLRHPQARVSIDAKLYRVIVSELNDESVARKVETAYNKKYDMGEVFGDDIPKWWFYRLDQAPVSPGTI